MEHQSEGLQRLLHGLRRRVGVVIICCIAVPASAFAVSVSQQKQYTATASLLFRDPGFDQKLFGSQVLAPSTDPTREAATNVKLVSLDVVAQRTAKRLPGASAGSVRQHVSVEPQGESDVVDVSATDPSPRRAAAIANIFADQFIASRREADRAKIKEAQDLIQRRLSGALPGQQAGAQSNSLREQLNRLELLSSLQTGNAELAEAAEAPSNPSSPKTVRNTAVGVFLGLLLGIALALLLERLDRRLHAPKEVEDIFDRPILGAIPDSRTFSRSGPTREGLPTKEGESFRMLRTNLRYFNIDRRDESVLITSAAPGDGKSTVAWNLACAAAAAGDRVLLLEADLRHPALANNLGLDHRPGLSTVLSGRAAVEEVAQQIPVPAQGNAGGIRTVDVLLAGPPPPNPADLLESDRMREVIADAERAYDLLVVDTPPIPVVSDAIPLLAMVGGVIVVARLGRTTREAAAHLRNQLNNLDAQVLGIVVNALRSDNTAYGYGYGYGEIPQYESDSGPAVAT